MQKIVVYPGVKTRVDKLLLIIGKLEGNGPVIYRANEAFHNVRDVGFSAPTIFECFQKKQFSAIHVDRKIHISLGQDACGDERYMNFKITAVDYSRREITLVVSRVYVRKSEMISSGGTIKFMSVVGECESEDIGKKVVIRFGEKISIFRDVDGVVHVFEEKNGVADSGAIEIAYGDKMRRVRRLTQNGRNQIRPPQHKKSRQRWKNVGLVGYLEENGVHCGETLDWPKKVPFHVAMMNRGARRMEREKL